MSTSTDETVSDVRKAAAALGPQIRAAADEIGQGRRLPPRIAQAMKECGVFGMSMPQAWGGAGLDPLEQLRVIETLRASTRPLAGAQ
jgi:alkylation response protein AidB-like acyl-CoA dehydrogenase